ncbi:bifunctional 2-polyprenyl-6-hydroxyphenol methylase/3-demethylubiquinol 3-O-methyltransferase UbiG [Thalassobacillus sp. CUG 92003]|uniref:class I SAM-dependent methyltransferase n=1 Tax=Thalassobacillus sp. CUG 92003 TaxID=2736641 RepID=UPI0015E6A9DD|nr:class I SAM-dependent methyltransferase [Thalassobacillus sp. CUG 92003]
MTESFEWHVEAERKWNERAEFWNANSQNMWDEGSRKTIIPFMKRYLKEGTHIADIGCGDGYGSFKLNQAGFAVTGLDISPEMVELAKNNLENEQLTFMQGDLAGLPFESNQFNGIMAINSLEWVEHPYVALKELKRVTKPGGRLCVGVLGPTAHPRENSYLRLYGEDVICNTMMPWEFEKMARENGFNILDGHGVYKRGVSPKHVADLPKELEQSLSFLWVSMLELVE